MTKSYRWVIQYLPFIVIGLSYIWALSVVGSRLMKTEAVTKKKVIVIAHWQLEGGVRDGINAAAAEYEKTHPDVEIRQEAIPETGYGQWLTVQMLGGTAPDIIEMGQPGGNLLTLFYQKYIVPITPYISKPNPYNKGTELEHTPLIKTYLDGMRLSYIPETQEYMTLSMARLGQRLIYNKELLKKLTGLDEAPTDFRQFLAVCKKIKETPLPDGSGNYTPISSSAYHLNGWNASLFMPATYGSFRDFDFAHNGRPGAIEWAMAFQNGRISLNHPSYKGSYALFREISQYFQPGWTGLQRNEALFKFAQEKAVFISSGLWEISGVEDLAAGKYHIGFLDYPLPNADDPEYGHLVEGPRYESTSNSIPFAVTRTSLHQDVAFDFLLFLASQKENEEFNARLGWLPIIIGAKSSPKLQVFEPTLEGVFPALFPALGGNATIRWTQLQALFQVGQLSYDDMVRQYSDFYKTGGVQDYQEFIRNIRRGEPGQASFAGQVREKAIHSNTPQNSEEWLHYRQVALVPIQSETGIVYYNTMVTDPAKYNVPLYQYSPEAWEHIRAAANVSPTTVKNQTP